jgi:hypothetical protein
LGHAGIRHAGKGRVWTGPIVALIGGFIAASNDFSTATLIGRETAETGFCEFAPDSKAFGHNATISIRFTGMRNLDFRSRR